MKIKARTDLTEVEPSEDRETPLRGRADLDGLQKALRMSSWLFTKTKWIFGETKPRQRFSVDVKPVRLNTTIIFFSAGCPAMAGFST